ncbi:MAG: DEAD/DEAH box helicase [Candidatus Delongbacteria bacterium]|nr:DEAD/DEAH box helicase [Candidatus Delongbacteria bacterium]
MNLPQFLDALRSDPHAQANIIHWQTLSANSGHYTPFPPALKPEMKSALGHKGIHQLYSHQAEAFERIQAGQHVVIVTPTASGKTLCYNLPVLNAILERTSVKALYLFPTKALAQDQLNELYELIKLLEQPIRTYTFDGDTPSSARQAVRIAGDIVITNPDMLHTGILPHHTIWFRFFECLQYVVIDELHIYRGIFGSQTANVIRRLKRIAAFYGRRLQFICCSATIGNPAELASRLIGEPVELIDRNGAPRGEKHIVFYNPPVVNRELGIRRSSLKETVYIGGQLLKNKISTIIFARSRLRVEILLTELKQRLGPIADQVRGYRGGYLPLQRRQIEEGLRDGSVTGVVSTNALELGVDIGQLDAAILTGFPGSISSLWQQSGRAGRGQKPALTLLVATSSPIDQYLMQHPEYAFQQSPEHAVINPDNLLVLTDHLKCALFEIPFQTDEKLDQREIKDILDYLKENQIAAFSGNKYYWSSSVYPAQTVNLRCASPENVTICDMSRNGKIIGETDFFSAPVLLHDEAVYIHQSETYQVKHLDWEKKRAFVFPVISDYYTDAQEKVDIKVLTQDESRSYPRYQVNYGELAITRLAVMFKKIKFSTHENVGWGQINLPEIPMPTAGCWLDFTHCPDRLTNLQDLGNALLGISHLFREIAPIYLFCDKHDINSSGMICSVYSNTPAIFFFDNYPGGIGLSLKFYHIIDDMIQHAIRFIQECPCAEGCPSCVGPLDDQVRILSQQAMEPSRPTLPKKQAALILLSEASIR